VPPLTPAVVALAEALLAGLAPAAHRLGLVLCDEHGHRVDRHLARLRRGSVHVLQPGRVALMPLPVVSTAMPRPGGGLPVGHVGAGARQSGGLLGD